MRKKSFVLILIGLLLVVGCGIGNSDRTSSADDWTLDKNKEDLFAKVEKISKDGKPLDLIAYLDKNIIRMRSDELTESIYILNTMQRKYLADYNESLDNREYKFILDSKFNSEDDIKLKDKEKAEEYFSVVENDGLKNILLEAYLGGYKLVRSRNGYKFLIDYDQYKEYENNALSEIKTYIAIQRENQDFINNKNFKLENLASKLISLEEQLVTYKEGYGYEELLRMYSEDFRLLLEGNKDNPIIDEENKIKPEVLNIYKSIGEKDTITSDALNKYLKVLEESEGKMTEEVLDSVLTIHNEVIALLEK